MTLHTHFPFSSAADRAYPSGLEPVIPCEPCAGYPRQELAVPPGVHRAGRYELRFARSGAELRYIQRLRLEVLNLEQSEGSRPSYEVGFGHDEFDLRSHHLMVIDREDGAVVGTYSLMTHELARRHDFYAATAFELGGLPDPLLQYGVELGRACLHRDHRSGRVIQLLWRGIARYLDWNDKRFVFGCCSIPSLNLAEIAGVSLELARAGHVHPRWFAAARQGFHEDRHEPVVALGMAALPPLFTSYLRLGAKVCGGPARGREFGVTDYLVVLDLRDVQPHVLASLSAPGVWQTVA